MERERVRVTVSGGWANGNPTTHSRILPWESQRTEEPGGPQSMGSHKSGTRLKN